MIGYPEQGGETDQTTVYRLESLETHGRHGSKVASMSVSTVQPKHPYMIHRLLVIVQRKDDLETDEPARGGKMIFIMPSTGRR